MIATIYERGNGFPDDGYYVPGSDAELYRVVKMGSNIMTGGPGNHIPNCSVELANWDDVESDDVYECLCLVDDDSEGES